MQSGTRIGFQTLAQLRIAEAQALLASGHYAGAYYLAGYAVECALKACIAKQVKEGDFPDKKKVVEAWKHDLVPLLGLAGLSGDIKAGPTGRVAHWATVAGWDSSSRYDEGIAETEATAIIEAITSTAEGILPWLQTHW